MAIEATKSRTHKMDNFVTLGTPARDDYRPNISNIGNWVNVYSTHDAVQDRGGHGDRSCWGKPMRMSRRTLPGSDKCGLWNQHGTTGFA